jgi:hypothetical protein
VRKEKKRKENKRHPPVVCPCRVETKGGASGENGALTDLQEAEKKTTYRRGWCWRGSYWQACHGEGWDLQTNTGVKKREKRTGTSTRPKKTRIRAVSIGNNTMHISEAQSNRAEPGIEKVKGNLKERENARH